MALVERAVVMLMMMAAIKVSSAAVYRVGDSAGWTIIGNIDYKKWAPTKNFQVGDTISKSPQSHCLLFFIYIVSILVQFFFLENGKSFQ